MPKLPVLSAKDVIRILEGRGFVLDHSTDSRRVYYHAASGRRAVLSYHGGDLPIGTMMAIFRGVGVPREEWTH